MKIPTILSALLATSLAITAHAAPTTSPTDDPTLFTNLVKYDHKAADALVAHYNNAVYGSSSSRTNAIGAKAAASKDILPFCVAIASNPTRTRVYKNKQSCDSKGWTTLFVFTAHTKKDRNHAAYPVCIGSAKNPDRSLIQTMKENCDGNGWKHESTLYYSGQLVGDKPVSTVHESTEIYRATKPDRMMFYPYYAGDKHGWGASRTMGYRSRWRLAASREMKLLKADLPSHAAVNKKIKIVSPPDVFTKRCVQNLIQVTPGTHVDIDTKKPTTFQGKNINLFVEWAKRDECSHLVSSSSIQHARTTIAKTGFTSIEIVIKNKVYAAVSVRGNVALPEYYIHLALQESVRTGQSIPVTVDNIQEDQIMALVAGTVATFGGKETFNRAIPKK